MLPKKQRIPRKLFKQILDSKRSFFNSTLLTLKFFNSSSTRVAVSVSKKISKKAVIRNRTRRRIYSQIKNLIPHLQKGSYLIVAKRGADKLKGEILQKELSQLFSKLVITN